MNTLKEQLQQLKIYDVLGRLSSNVIKNIRKNEALMKDIIEKTNFLHNNPTLSQRIHAILKNIDHHPLCKHCNINYVMFNPHKTKNLLFSCFCSKHCALKSELRKQKIKNTNIKKYNSEYHQTSEQGKLQRIQTNIARYGSLSPAKNKLVRQKIKQTNLKKYGHENIFGSNYGKEKIKQTNIQKYGEYSYMTSKLSDYAKQHLTDKEWLENQNKHFNKTLYDIAEDLKCSPACVHQYFKKYNIIVLRQKQSNFEKDVCKFLNNLNISYQTNVKINNIEYDIVIPGHNLCIECNGIYWHGKTKNKTKNYHINKTLNAAKHNYKTIHIFEDQWVWKQEIVKSRLKHLLQISDQRERIFARDCIIVPVQSFDAKEFFIKNHLFGYVNASIIYGLKYKQQFVAMISFSKGRYDDTSQFEILRFATDLNKIVVGSFSKLFSYFIKQYKPQTVISYADLCWGEGTVYQKMGFQRKNNTSPNYRYFKINECLKLYSRLQFQKHKLSKILETYDPNLNEYQNMLNNGYDRIWDCGNAKWLWKND